MIINYAVHPCATALHCHVLRIICAAYQDAYLLELFVLPIMMLLGRGPDGVGLISMSICATLHCWGGGLTGGTSIPVLQRIMF